jgi:hypothetical protein
MEKLSLGHSLYHKSADEKLDAKASAFSPFPERGI